MELYNADGIDRRDVGQRRALPRGGGAARDHADVGVARRAHRRRGPYGDASHMDGDAGYGSVAMGEVSFGDRCEGTLGAANVGNPHVVVLDHADVERRAARGACCRMAGPVGGANVEFVTMLDRRPRQHRR